MSGVRNPPAVMWGNREATSMDQIPPVIGSKDRPKPAYGDVGALMGPEDPRGQSCSRGQGAR